MASTTIVIGTLLVLLGVIPYFVSASHSPTALIPAYVGAVLVLLGFVARNDRLRKHAMHVAVIVGLLGFLAAAGRLIMSLARGNTPTPLSAVSLIGMALLTGVFVVLCVRSFIAARRQRVAASAGAAQ